MKACEKEFVLNYFIKAVNTMCKVVERFTHLVYFEITECNSRTSAASLLHITFVNCKQKELHCVIAKYIIVAESRIVLINHLPQKPMECMDCRVN